jgi:hypothetical protein
MSVDFNAFAKKNNASVLQFDEELILQKEMREEIIFWGSVYGSEFVEMPDNAFTSEPAYRMWCWKTTGMMPRKRTPQVFDDYIRPRMEAAAIRKSLAGTEYGVEVDDAIESALSTHVSMRCLKDLDSGAELQRGDAGVWVETVDGSRGREVIIRIKWLMEKLSLREMVGNTEVKIKRKDVCKRLVHYGRQVGGRDAAVNRHRCAYALPIEFLDGGFEALHTQPNLKK